MSLIIQEGCSDQSLYTPTQWVGLLPLIIRKVALISQTIFVYSNIGCESNSSDYLGRLF